MAKILLSTVWHTGSEYVRKELQDQGHNVIFQHCEAHLHYVLKHQTDFDQMVTTFRDPLLTGASWGNRYDLFEEYRIISYWYELWSTWSWFIRDYQPQVRRASLFAGPKINSEPDENDLHAALKAGDMDHYYEYVPRDFIDWAWKEVGASRILV